MTIRNRAVCGAAALAFIFTAAACDKGEEGGKNTKAVASAEKGELDKAVEGAAVKASEIKNMVKKGKPISAAQYEKLILAHADCKVTDNGIDSKCEAVKVMRESMNRSQLAKGALGGNAGLGKKLINHEAPAVRIKAAGLMGSLLGTGKDSQAIIVKAAEKEKVPAVLAAMIRTVRNDGAKNPDVAKMLMKAADHETPLIRKEAVYALSSSWNAKMEGGPDKLISMMKEDKDMDVRKAACKYAGKLGDEKMFPEYKTLLENDKEDEALRAECFRGLVSMWANYPLYGTHNEDAYKLTIKHLNKTPRTDKMPPWTAMSEFGHLGSEKNKKLDEWKEKAKFFKADDVKKALISIVGDKDANWMARTGATRSLKDLGATKAELEKLRKGLGDDPKGTDSHVAKELDKAISGAK